MIEAIPINGETWLICGGRDFSNREMFDGAIGDIVRLRGGCPLRVIEGGALGADALAAEWAYRLALTHVQVRANWPVHGRAAGAIRNQTMLDLRPDVVVAFPGGKGTADMVSRARKAGVTVIEITLANQPSEPGAGVGES